MSENTKDDIFQWLQERLKSDFQLSMEDLQPTAHLMDDLDLDSIDAVDLSVRVEEKYDLSLSQEDLKSMQTIRDVVDLIHERL